MWQKLRPKKPNITTKQISELNITIVIETHFELDTIIIDDTPPSSLMDSIVNPKMKTMEGEGVGARSLARSTSRVEGVLEFRDGTRKIDKHFIYSHRPT